ncbi:DNA cytosine methyltransferase [Desulfovibrio subterraneus]|uniref:DNA cytosine methyltransferase n=1 Tax=Desulfovibrio subterraneus TaxID=2718620 RepID=UPI0022B926A3|nr:DNA cytosine methyltransferase [Desulfovibrio subterraneus]WBF66053.1 DNA cytosine methyltransferase [Desulfovibrio subterraneus]
MKVKVIDLFAGAGGFTVAAQMAGCEVALSVEIDRVACETLETNHGASEIVCGDICDYSGEALLKRGGIKSGTPVIVVGGPPCQPFSKAAYWTDPGDDSRYRKARQNGQLCEKPKQILSAKEDSRRDLVHEFFRVVEEVDADAFVFENVTSILHPRNAGLFDGLISHAQSLGYNVAYGKLNSVHYGVAQRRERVFIVGSRKGKPTLPNPTHYWDKSVGRTSSKVLPFVSVESVIEEFSGPKFFEPEEVIVGRWAEHLKTVPPGMNYKAHTAWAGHPNPTFVTETRFWNFLLKLDPKLPSWTLAASPGPWTGPFHWASRRLRTPEMAAIQSFPEGYVFRGTRRDRVRQIGNAVPPVLAEKVISQLLGVM